MLFALGLALHPNRPAHAEGLRGGWGDRARPAERSTSKEQSPVGSAAGDSPQHDRADARDCGATATTAVTDVPDERSRAPVVRPWRLRHSTWRELAAPA